MNILVLPLPYLASNLVVGRKMKKTLIFELFASILVVGLLAGLNALMGKSSDLDRELTLLSLNTANQAINAHRRHHGAGHGHAGRHHERRRHEGSPNQAGNRRQAEHFNQGTQSQAQPAAPQAVTIPHPASPAATPAGQPHVQ